MSEFFSWPFLRESQNGTQTSSLDGLSQSTTIVSSGSSSSSEPGLSQSQFSALLDIIDNSIPTTTSSPDKLISHEEQGAGPFDYFEMTDNVNSTLQQHDKSHCLDLNSPSSSSSSSSSINSNNSSSSNNQHVPIEKFSKLNEKFKAHKKMITQLQKSVDLYKDKTVNFFAGSNALAAMTKESDDPPLPEIFNKNFTSAIPPRVTLKTTATYDDNNSNKPNSVPIPEPDDADLLLRDIPGMTVPFAHSMQFCSSCVPSSSSSSSDPNNSQKGLPSSTSSTDWESQDDKSQPSSQIF